MRVVRRILAVFLASVAGIAQAQQPSQEDLENCKRIEDREERLKCFDALVAERKLSLIGERWGIDTPDRDTRFDFRPHKANYLLAARYSDEPNTLPASPTKQPLAAPLAIDRTELKFQISFKVKVADFEHLVDGVPPAALWVAYTQQSHWQIYNAQVSRPFRETNYEPEAMLAFFPDRSALGWRWRLAALGLDHQSNGQSDPLSRSWNRVYLLFGIERDNLALLVRPWLRLKEQYSKDDNPDITKYLGYGDITVVYAADGHTLSLIGRYNAGTNKGALQGAWNFPLVRRVRGYVQVFSGYGESLIDYNWRQTTIGIGVSLSDAL